MDNNQNIQDLKHTFEAQTEAYVQFNNALVKIIELQNQIKTDLTSNTNLEITELRSIFEKVLVISTLLNEYVKNKNGIGQELDEYNAVLSNFGSELTEFKNDLQLIINSQAVNSEIEKFTRKISESNTLVRNESAAIKTELANIKLENKNHKEYLELKIKNLSLSQNKFNNRVYGILAGCGGAFVLFQVLSSLGMLTPLGK
jgi:hypothetical protein